MAVGRSLDLQPLKRLNPLNFHKISVWRHRIQHGYHSIVAPCARATPDRRGAGRRRRARLIARVVARRARAYLHTLGRARRGRHGGPAAAGLRWRGRPARAQRHGQRGARHVAVGAKDAERLREERVVREPRGAVATSARHARAPPPPLGVTTARAAPNTAIDATSSASCSGPPNSSVAAVCGRCSRHQRV
jgi:hypothetical protein